MAEDVKMTGFDRLAARLKAMAARHKSHSETDVVYGGNGIDYAVLVHEDMEASHRVGGPKYLEQASRTTALQGADAVRKALAAGATLEDALAARAGLVLEASQPLVPVRSGALKASGRVEVK